MKVVHIAGISGVGKSFVCDRLTGANPRVKCIDLDSFFQKHHGMAWERLENEIGKARAANNDDILILNGMHRIPFRCDLRIVLVSADMGKTYREYMLRNLDAIVSNEKRIRRIMRASDVEQMQGRIVGALWANFDIVQTFEDYQKEAGQYNRSMRKRGYVTATQKEAQTLVSKM